MKSASVCVQDLFERWANETPDALAIEFDGRTLNYATLNARANQVARLLRASGVTPDARVAMCLERGFDLVVGVLAILKAGGAYVPLDPSYPPARLAEMLRDCAPSLVLGDEAGVFVLAEVTRGSLGPAIVDIDSASAYCADDLDRIAIGLRSSHLAYVIYTSGSTGAPKGVMVEHRNVVNLLADMTRRLSLAPGAVVPAITPISFDISGMEVLLPLSAGQRVLMVPRNISRDPIALTKALDRDDLAFVQATPSTWRGLVEAGWRSRGAAILCGGEALPPHLAHRLLEQNADVWNVYGPTETTIWSTAAKLVDAITIGRPLANTRVYVLGEDGNPVRPGESGEIYIGGAGVARGYWNRPKLTAERFIASPFVEGERLYRTGDLGRMLENGEIAFIGRNDTQVKVRGARVELGEVEAVLAQDSNVAQCAVVTQSDASGADRLVAYVVASGAKATPQGLRRRLTERLPDYMIPDLVVIRERFPLTPNGKIDRGLLSTPAEAIAGETIPLGDDVEQRIAQIWSDALGASRIDRDASFFDLGGNSMLMIAIAAKVQDSFGMEVDLQEFFDEPTIACLARQASGALKRRCREQESVAL